MKKFRQLAILLLAGVMALMVFSGCGDGTTPFEREVESAGIEIVNAMRNNIAGEELPELYNDSDIRQKGLKMLGYIDPETGLIDYENSWMGIDTYKDGKYFKTYIVVVTADYSVSNKILAQEISSKTLKELKAQFGVETARMSSYYHLECANAIGVAARTINGKTYMAWGFTVDMDKVPTIIS